jgi:hypothetical protein
MAIEHERFERLRLVVEWLMCDFANSRECFWSLLSTLSRFCHMRSMTLPEEDLLLLENNAAEMDWLRLRSFLLRDILGFFLRMALDTRERTEGFKVTGTAPRVFVWQKGKNGAPDTFEWEVRIFDPLWLAYQHQHDAAKAITFEKVREYLSRYLTEIFLSDLVGLSDQAVGICRQCEKLFVNRRSIHREFCSSRCRLKHAQLLATMENVVRVAHKDGGGVTINHDRKPAVVANGKRMRSKPSRQGSEPSSPPVKARKGFETAATRDARRRSRRTPALPLGELIKRIADEKYGGDLGWIEKRVDHPAAQIS